MNPGPARPLLDTSVPNQLATVVAWSATSIDEGLLDAPLDPEPFVAFVAPGTRWFYWELHFAGAGPRRVDFLHRPSLRVQANSGGFLPPDPILDQLVDWYANGETSRYLHDTAWLEIDGPLSPDRSVQQGVSVCLEPDIGNRNAASVPPKPSTAIVTDVFTKLQAACGQRSRGTTVLAEIAQSLDAVGGFARHLSVMRGRPGSPAKLYAAIPQGRLSQLLDAIGWPGDRTAAVQLAELVCAESRNINIDLSFEDNLKPRVGYEQFFDPSPARDPWRRGATSLACSLGLLTPAQAAALGRWVGSYQVRCGNTFETKLLRWLDVKFVITPEGLEFKAYLGFRMLSD